jgi:hypothetical protein
MDKLFGMGKSLLSGGSKKSGNSSATDENGNNLLDNINPMAMFQSLDKNGDGKSLTLIYLFIHDSVFLGFLRLL